MSTSEVVGMRLSPQQRALWCLDARGEQPVTRAVVRLRGELDAQRLRGAIEAVVRRHEALRTSFSAQAGLKYPLQVVAARAEVLVRNLTVQDQAALDSATRAAW